MSANGIPELPTAPGRTGSSFKLLAFGGASRGAVLLVLMAVAGFLLLSCGESGPPSPGSTLHLVPANAEEFSVINIAEMKASPDLAEAMEIDLSEEFVLGLAWEDFDEITFAEWEGNGVSVLKGGFDFDDVRDELEELGLEESSYRGYELWERFALLQEDGYLVFSSSPDPVEEVLKNLYRDEGHLAGAEDNDLKRILEKLPEGFLKVASVREGFCPVKRCQGAGISATGMDLDREAVTGEIAILFSSERSAEDAAEEYDAIADFVKEEWDSDLENTESDGEFVIGTATEKISDDDTSRGEEPAAPNLEEERALLEAFFHATNGPNWFNKDHWLTDSPISDWYGIERLRNGHVASLNLESNGLTGTIPPEIGKMLSLETLNLESNGLTGTIPPEIGEMLSLETLHLASNGLTGTIPPEIGEMLSLETLHLAANELTGTIPPEIGEMPSLEILNLAANELSGTIPPEIGEMPSLTRLIVNNNSLSGNIPPELGRHQDNFITLSVAGNPSLNGPLPHSLTAAGDFFRYISLVGTNVCVPRDMMPWIGSITLVDLEGRETDADAVAVCP